MLSSLEVAAPGLAADAAALFADYGSAYFHGVVLAAK